MINISKIKGDVVAASYHELGNYLINGWGLLIKMKPMGLIVFQKLDQWDILIQWFNWEKFGVVKRKSEKDLTKAAGWLRLSEIFGVKSIGNSWIYKEKYMN